MSFEVNKILSSPFWLTSIGVAFAGWVTAIVGIALAGPDRFTAWETAFLILPIGGTLIAAGSDSLSTYRLALIPLYVIGAVYATMSANTQLFLAPAESKAAGAGFVIVSFSLFAWMVVIGIDRLLVSTSQSVLGYNAKAGQSIYPYGGQATPRTGPYGKQKMTSVSVTATPKAHPANSSTTNISIRPATSDSGGISNPPDPDVTMSGVHIEVAPMAVYGYKAIAAYSYTASADDANELSFTKGEILDIVDNQGKWWQARKADGTIGIVPSNYLKLLPKDG